jgi:hypothetical protein
LDLDPDWIWIRIGSGSGLDLDPDQFSLKCWIRIWMDQMNTDPKHWLKDTTCLVTLREK